jgi:hypothetical protein
LAEITKSLVDFVEARRLDFSRHQHRRCEGWNMSSVVLDREILGRLESSHRRVEVLDEDGCLRGFFVPVDDPTNSPPSNESQDKMTLPPGVVIPFDHDEIQRALAEPGGRSLHEMLTDLRARP